jgi:hypothetical protein
MPTACFQLSHECKGVLQKYSIATDYVNTCGFYIQAYIILNPLCCVWRTCVIQEALFVYLIIQFFDIKSLTKISSNRFFFWGLICTRQTRLSKTSFQFFYGKNHKVCCGKKKRLWCCPFAYLLYQENLSQSVSYKIHGWGVEGCDPPIQSWTYCVVTEFEIRFMEIRMAEIWRCLLHPEKLILLGLPSSGLVLPCLVV